MSAIDDKLGARIRAARSYAKLGQGALAHLIGVGREAVIAMEAGQREPTVREVKKIATTTDTPVGFLLHGWSAAPELLDRVAVLEERLTRSEADRDLLHREIEALNETIEARYAELAEQALPTDTRRSQTEDRPA